MFKKNYSSRLDSFIENPKKAMWNLSIPRMMGLTVNSIYLMIDTAFIGRWIGDDGLAGIGYVFPFVFIIMGITFGLGTGTQTLISQYIGKKEKKMAEVAATHCLLIGFFITLIIIIFGLFFGESIIAFQGANNKALGLALSYFNIIVLGSIFSILSIFFTSILAGEGDTLLSFKLLGTGTVLNIILDPIFIIYWGIEGAAYATVISQAIVCFCFIYLLIFKNVSYLSISFKNFRYNSLIVNNLFNLGVPPTVSFFIMSMGMFTYNAILNDHDAVAAFQTAGRIENLFFLPIFAISGSLNTLSGMFYGAKRMDLVKNIVKYGIVISTAISIIGSFFFYFLMPYVIHIFTSSPNIGSIAIQYFKIFAFAFPFVSIAICSSRVMQGLGYSIPMLVITILRVIVISCSLAWYFVNVLGLGFLFAWYATLISCIVSAFIGFIWMMKKYQIRKLELEFIAK